MIIYRYEVRIELNFPGRAIEDSLACTRYCGTSFDKALEVYDFYKKMFENFSDAYKNVKIFINKMETEQIDVKNINVKNYNLFDWVVNEH